MKVVTVVGARPQFIKCGPVSALLRLRCREVLVHTGQHYDDGLSGRFFRELDLPAPDYRLAVGSGPHGAQTGAMLGAVEEVLAEERPDLVLVYGDTNSTLAGALAAAKLGIPVAHVEAGLRSGNRHMPEEVNRVMTDHLATLLFCPTACAVRSLKREGITRGVYRTGDVMLDALRRHAPGPAESAALLRSLDVEAGGFFLATVHRAENTDAGERLRGILEGLSRLDLPVLLPLHPRTREAADRAGLRINGAVRPLPPMGYREMLALQRAARAVLTDSGGMQKEACFLGTPCITLRDETEWTETVQSGGNILVGADPVRILRAGRECARPPRRARAFGGGGAAARIVDRIVEWFEGMEEAAA